MKATAWGREVLLENKLIYSSNTAIQSQNNELYAVIKFVIQAVTLNFVFSIEMLFWRHLETMCLLYLSVTYPNTEVLVVFRVFFTHLLTSYQKHVPFEIVFYVYKAT